VGGWVGGCSSNATTSIHMQPGTLSAVRPLQHILSWLPHASPHAPLTTFRAQPWLTVFWPVLLALLDHSTTHLSCPAAARPNCEARVLTVNGQQRVFLSTAQDIPAGEELT
jgi:hypothetical protein